MKALLLLGALAALLRGAAVELAQQGPGADPARIAREAPDSLREYFRRSLAASVAARTPAARDSALGTARSLAAGWHAAWSDSILLRELGRFERRTPRERVQKVRADSLRRAGFLAYNDDGPEAALRLWRRARTIALALADSTGLAATLGNIGAAHLALGNLDSAALHLERSRALAERARDWRTLGNALGLLGSLASTREDYPAARVAYASALAVRDRSGDDRGAVADANNLGLVADALGDTAAARRAFNDAVARNRRAGRDGAAAVNLANLAMLEERAGRYSRAASLHREALGLHRKAGEDAASGLDLRAIGNLALRQGDYRAAVEALAEAASILARTGPPDEAAAASADLAQAYAAAGDLGMAARVVERAERTARGDGAAALAPLALVRGDLAVDANAFGDAGAAYARAESLYTEAGDPVGTAAARQGLGALELRRGNPARAAAALEAAAAAQRASGDKRTAALTELILGVAQLERGDTARALATTRAAYARLRTSGDPAAEAAALAALGDLAEARGSVAEAERFYRQGLSVSSASAIPGVVAPLRWGLGRVLRARGDLAGAATELTAAIDAVEQVAAPLPLGTTRWLLLSDVAALHADLALVEHERGRSRAAFEASERMRGRQMRELLARGGPLVPAGADAAVALRERELQRHIASLETAALALPARGHRDLSGGAVLPDGGALAAARAEHRDIIEALGASPAPFASLVSLPRVEHAAVRARLRSDEAILEYLVSDSVTLLFVVTRDSTEAVRLPVGRRELAAAVDFSRAAIESPATPSAREPWRAPLRRLHRLLVAPAEETGLLRNVRSLLVAPHAELHYLPFAALVAESGRHLVERYDVAYIPSAAIWLELGARGRAAENGRVLALAPFPGSLPGSRDEVREVGRMFGRSARVLVGGEASEAALVTEAPGHSVVHLATFGVLNRHNPLYSFVALAPSRGESGRLEVHEVFGRSLRARLLVLSACETGLASGAAADVPAGDDWVGLVRAFLFAGADNVMATLWPIEDRPTSRIIPAFYRNFRGESPAGALARTQRAAIRNPDTAAPRHWAAFVVVGGQ